MSQALRITAIVAAYNEEDIIESVVRGLIDEGISVYLIDNQSDDGTVAAVERYVGRGVIGIERFPTSPESATASTGFRWTDILARKQAIAAAVEGDWFIHHDADEFRESPWPGSTLSDGIARVDAAGYNAIDFAVFNFPPTNRTSDTRDVRDAFRYYEDGDTWDRTQIKCWKNTGQAVDLVSSGGHEARFDGRRVFPIRFILRHYPIRSQAHGARKVFTERRPRFTPEERARGWHVQYDALAEDHSFVRDPATLRLYDPDLVRTDLQIHHRYVEELRTTLEAQRIALEAAHALSDQFRIDLQSERGMAAGLRNALDREREMSGHVRDELSQTGARVDDVTRRLEAVHASRSWRVTAPLRALQRLVTPR